MGKKKIGCLGLSANPPHLGHLGIAEKVLEKRLVDEVWLIPIFKHSFGKKLARVEDRWQMVKFLKGDKIKINDIELQRKGKSLTIETVKILIEKYPSCEFTWIIGSDIVKSREYKRWDNWDELFSLTKFIVVSRPGFEVEKLPTGFIEAGFPSVDISSSEIRERIAGGLCIDRLVPKQIREYIEEKGLYKD